MLIRLNKYFSIFRAINTTKDDCCDLNGWMWVRAQNKLPIVLLVEALKNLKVSRTEIAMLSNQ